MSSGKKVESGKRLGGIYKAYPLRVIGGVRLAVVYLVYSYGKFHILEVGPFIDHKRDNINKRRVERGERLYQCILFLSASVLSAVTWLSRE